MGYNEGMSPADLAAVTRNNDGFMGDGNGWWILLLFLVLGGRGFGFGGGGGGVPCATQADVRAAVDQQTLISKLDQQTYGIADSTYALNNTLNQNFRGVDNAICNLGFNMAQGFNTIGSQLAQCCCETQGAIKDVAYQNAMNTNAITKQISDCCCSVEKDFMQGRFDAQVYNTNTLMAIDKLGDRIIDYMCQNEKAALRDENFALKLAASQANQNQYLIHQLRPAPMPAFTVPAPYGFCNCTTTPTTPTVTG